MGGEAVGSLGPAASLLLTWFCVGSLCRLVPAAPFFVVDLRGGGVLESLVGVGPRGSDNDPVDDADSRSEDEGADNERPGNDADEESGDEESESDQSNDNEDETIRSPAAPPQWPLLVWAQVVGQVQGWVRWSLHSVN